MNGGAQLNAGLSVNLDKTQKVRTALDVTGDSQLQGALSVTEQTTLESGLTVAQATQLDSTLKVAGKTHLEDTLQLDKKALIRGDIELSGNLGLSVEQAEARLHLRQTDTTQAALKIDDVSSATQSQLIFTQGRLGIGRDTPAAMLDVDGETRLRQDVEVEGRLNVSGDLCLRDDAHLHDNLYVYDRTELRGHTQIGPIASSEQHEPFIAQLNLNKGREFDYSLLIDVAQDHPIAVKDGKLGIGTLDPQVPFQVQGNSQFNGNVSFGGDCGITPF